MLIRNADALPSATYFFGSSRRPALRAGKNHPQLEVFRWSEVSFLCYRSSPRVSHVSAPVPVDILTGCRYQRLTWRIRLTAIPADPLAFIQRCVRQRKILWTYHVNMRIERRHISRDEILGAVDVYEIIESYPEDKYLPSYLVAGGDRFHVLFAADMMNDNVRIVTAYRPDPNEWEPGARRRKTG